MSRTRHHGDKAKERAFGAGWRWLSQTPGWWVRLFMTKPKRAETTRLLKKVGRIPNIEDAPEFPVAKKPHKYFY